jgi:serine/threonine protein kinase
MGSHFSSFAEDPARPPVTQTPSASLSTKPAEFPTLPPENVPNGPASPSLPTNLPADFGRYRLLRQLGQGAMGAVYLAHDTELDRLVALKVPVFDRDERPSVLERFSREARAAATLLHPNICPVYDVGELGGVRYLTMAFIEGQTLADLLRSAGRPLPGRDAALLVRTLAQALDEAHRARIVHRDLKPGNVMVNRRGEPILMDFGLAHRADGTDSRLTKQGAVLGTPSYMAPEQARGILEDQGPACDIYSLGMILYELLTHRLPFEGSAYALVIQKVIDNPPSPRTYRPDLDPTLEAICLKAIARQPANRYPSMSELAGALTAYLDSPGPATAQPPTTPDYLLQASTATTPETAAPALFSPGPRPRTGPPKRLRNWVIPFALAVGLGLLAAWLCSAFRNRAALQEQNDTRSNEHESIPSVAPAPNLERKPVDPAKVWPEKAGGGGKVKVPALGTVLPYTARRVLDGREPVGYAWPANELRAGLVPAPDLGRAEPLFQDTFADAKSGFPVGEARDGFHGYVGGRYVIVFRHRTVQLCRVPLDRVRAGAPDNGLACEIVGNVSGWQGLWGVALAGPGQEDRVTVHLGKDGTVRVAHRVGGKAEVVAVPPLQHPAIHRGADASNTLLVILRGRQLEVYVNSVAVCDPVPLERALASPEAYLACSGPPDDAGVVAEFYRVTAWSVADLPPLAARGAVPRK